MYMCQECGRKFRTVRAAERAAFGSRGCPGCGGSVIDLAPPTVAQQHLGRERGRRVDDYLRRTQR